MMRSIQIKKAKYSTPTFNVIYIDMESSFAAGSAQVNLDSDSNLEIQDEWVKETITKDVEW